jgi:hypothetical protein
MVKGKIFLSELIIFWLPGQAIQTSLDEPSRRQAFLYLCQQQLIMVLLFNANLLKPGGLSAAAKGILQWVDPQNKIWPKRF